VWDDLADWYIEASKTSVNQPILSWALATCLQIAHPFAPFVTETIWQTLNYTTGVLAAERWPKAEEFDAIAAEQFERIRELVSEGRWVIAELPGNKKYSLLYGNDSLVENNLELIRRLMRLEKIEKIDQPRGLRLAATNRETWLDIDSDTLYQHQANLELRLANARKRLDGLNARLANESYLAKAPERLVTETKEEQQTTEKLIDRLVTELEVIQL
jgi:valyl-tRNA synthetase